jgi:hypothetical protein
LAHLGLIDLLKDESRASGEQEQGIGQGSSLVRNA